MVQSGKLRQVCDATLENVCNASSQMCNDGEIKSEHGKGTKNAKKMTFHEKMAPYSADILNPLEMHRPLPILQLMKSIVLTVTLLPLRLFLMFALLLFAWVVGKIALLGLPKNQALGLEPLSGWRRLWAKPFIVAVARFIFIIGGWYWIPQKGCRASVQEAPILLVMPHSSFLDTVLVIALGCPSMVVKDSTERAPFFGSLVKFQQPFFVKTEDPEARRRIAEDIQKRMKSEKDFEQLLIFPEAGCGNRRGLLQFKLGGFTPGVPVQPVFIRYKNTLDTITWTWDGPGALEQLWLTLTQFRIGCELEFLPVYKPSTNESENPRLFADNVQNFVSNCVGIPISHFSVDDAKYLLQAKVLQLPLTAAIIKLLKVRKTIGRNEINPREELEILRKQKDGRELRGSEKDMADYLGLDRCPEALKDFFHLMDQRKEGCLDLEIYDAGLCLLRRDLTVKARLKAAFEAFSTKNESKQQEHILLLWKGVPFSLTNLKTLDSLNKTEKELYIAQ